MGLTVAVFLYFVKFIFLTQVYTLFFLMDTGNEGDDTEYPRHV